RLRARGLRGAGAARAHRLLRPHRADAPRARPLRPRLRRGAAAEPAPRRRLPRPRLLHLARPHRALLGADLGAALFGGPAPPPRGLLVMLGQALRDQQHELSVFRNRLLLAGLLIVAAFSLLVARFTWLQVVKSEYYHTLAEANRISVVPVVPNRGLILDRNGQVLAANYSAYTLEVTPSKVPEL